MSAVIILLWQYLLSGVLLVRHCAAISSVAVQCSGGFGEAVRLQSDDVIM